METRHLIDAVVRQTTLLIAQLATSGGVRAPLAHIADEVFLELAREIEQQGVSRNVVADMFGLALRTYQKKVNRVRESVTRTERTLWESVLAYVREQDGATRKQVVAAFSRDEERHVVAVLGDLVTSGLLYGTGRGQHAAYGPVPERELRALVEEQGVEALAHMVWLEVADHPGVTRAELGQRFATRAAALDDALAGLVADGRIQVDAAPGGAGARYRTAQVLIAAGSEAGWETAVFDHFRAVCTAIGAKLRQGGPDASKSTLVGGSTLRFEVPPGHPHEQEVLSLLGGVRERAFDVWNRVSAHNRENPPIAGQARQIVFYFGQNVVEPAAEETEAS